MIFAISSDRVFFLARATRLSSPVQGEVSDQLIIKLEIFSMIVVQILLILSTVAIPRLLSGLITGKQ